MSLQNHIHLDTTLTDAPENSPELTWKITNRVLVPTVFMTVQRSLTGKLYKHRLTNENGLVRIKNYNYTLKVKADDFYSLEDRLELLEGMNGADVYLCDIFHADDGVDHTEDVRPMVLMVGEIPPISVGMPFFLIDVQLEDDTL